MGTCRLRVSPTTASSSWSGFAEEFHLRWFWASEPAADVWVRSAGRAQRRVIAGPKSRQLVQRLVRDDLSPSAFKLFQVRETAVGFAPAILTACRVHR